MIRRPPRSTLFPTRRSSDLIYCALFGVGRLILGPVWLGLGLLAGRVKIGRGHGRTPVPGPTSLSPFFFNDTATTEIYTFPYTTLFRSHLLRVVRRRPAHPGAGVAGPGAAGGQD